MFLSAMAAGVDSVIADILRDIGLLGAPGFAERRLRADAVEKLPNGCG
jgi:hypothetical protein